MLQAVGATRARPNWGRAQGEMRPGAQTAKDRRPMRSPGARPQGLENVSALSPWSRVLTTTEP